MRWNEKTKAQWILIIGRALESFSSDIELVNFEEGSATVKILNGEYSEDLHIKIQDHLDLKLDQGSGTVAIFFQE